MADGKKTYRIGYYVEVEADGVDERDAVVVADIATGWPAEWQFQREPIEVEQVYGSNVLHAKIIRSQALMVKEKTDG